MEAKMFQALADETRLKILELLSEGPMNVSSMVRRLGCLQPAVSRHLKVLRDSALIAGRRKGKEVEYTIAPHPIGEAIDYLSGLVRRAGSGTSGEKHVRLRPRRGGRKPKKQSGSQKTAAVEDVEREHFEFERKRETMDDFLL